MGGPLFNCRNRYPFHLPKTLQEKRGKNKVHTPGNETLECLTETIYKKRETGYPLIFSITNILSYLVVLVCRLERLMSGISSVYVSFYQIARRSLHEQDRK